MNYPEQNEGNLQTELSIMLRKETCLVPKTFDSRVASQYGETSGKSHSWAAGKLHLVET